jgi:hypothetical protein
MEVFAMRRPGQFIAAAVLAALSMTGCATMTAGSHVERGVDFTKYRTYDWGRADALPTGDPRLDNNPFFKDYFEGAIEKQLGARHFRRAKSKPDLLIHYHANISQRVEVNGVDHSRDACYNNYDCEPQVSEYDAGTLILDVVDARTKKVVWRGWAQDNMDGVIDNQDRLAQELTKAVSKMMEQFPRAL